ncbi:MAG: sigma factor [Pseudonocardiaceae bacterium]
MQDTLLAAGQGFGGFEGRASLRTWLYRIATNRCLNARRSASRRPAKEWDMPKVEPPEPTRLGEVVWLEPFPDALLDEGAIGVPLGPRPATSRPNPSAWPSWPHLRSCRPASSPSSSCVTSSDSA